MNATPRMWRQDAMLAAGAIDVHDRRAGAWRCTVLLYRGFPLVIRLEIAMPLAGPRRWFLAALLLLPLSVLAQTAVTLRAVNVRAGPDQVFPLVTSLQPTTQVHVFGCTTGWQWCDIAAGRVRGWVHSRYLTNMFRERIPIIAFSVEAYWDEHYRTRSWYVNRSAWAAWGSPGFHPPPPPPRTPLFGSR